MVLAKRDTHLRPHLCALRAPAEALYYDGSPESLAALQEWAREAEWLVEPPRGLVPPLWVVDVGLGFVCGDDEWFSRHFSVEEREILIEDTHGHVHS